MTISFLIFLWELLTENSFSFNQIKWMFVKILSLIKDCKYLLKKYLDYCIEEIVKNG